MSAFIEKRLVIDVTKGDCIDANRKSGKSNTGTYFISSNNCFDEFRHFFSENNIYKLDTVKLDVYKILFNYYFKINSNEYAGKMKDFDSTCSILSLYEYPDLKINLRVNDNRTFMKFEDNQEKIASNFRKLLYEDCSKIVIDHHKDNIYYVYPIININSIREDKNIKSGLIFDEEDSI